MTQELGYYFHPSLYGHPLGHPQLDIHLYDAPTQRHFDPERAEFEVSGLDGRSEQLTISHGWSGAKAYRICAGRIYMHDHKDKVAEAFSFGGQLTITNRAGYTECALKSDAPILDLVTPGSMATRLVSEFEAHLAKCRAFWGQHPAICDKKLAELAPLTLFTAGLVSLQEAYEAIPAQRRSSDILEELHVVHEVIALLQTQDLWPDTAVNLETLLAPATP
ncbi:MAG: hypothetical protein R3E31_25035 [Chloroflexota bacterium]